MGLQSDLQLRNLIAAPYWTVVRPLLQREIPFASQSHLTHVTAFWLHAHLEQLLPRNRPGKSRISPQFSDEHLEAHWEWQPLPSKLAAVLVPQSQGHISHYLGVLLPLSFLFFFFY